MPTINPYYKQWFRYLCAKMEFEYFRESATEIARSEVNYIARAAPLISAHGFIAQSFDKFTVQIWLGNRPTGRETINKGGSTAEIGATLLYSFGPTGRTAVILYLAKSEFMKAKEEYIVRALRNMTDYQLRRRIRRDLRDLVAYTYMTTLDGSPIFRERMRVSWIRLVCPMQIDGKQSRKGAQFAYKGVGFVARIGLIAALRPWGIFALILLLLWLGFSVSDLLKKGVSLQ